jgi:hypothetical protein
MHLEFEWERNLAKLIRTVIATDQEIIHAGDVITNILEESDASMLYAECISEMFVIMYETTLSHDPEGHHF